MDPGQLTGISDAEWHFGPVDRVQIPAATWRRSVGMADRSSTSWRPKASSPDPQPREKSMSSQDPEVPEPPAETPPEPPQEEPGQPSEQPPTAPPEAPPDQEPIIPPMPPDEVPTQAEGGS